MKHCFDSIVRWWRNWTTSYTNLAALSCCGADETEHIARDIGVSTPELRALAGRWPRSADLLASRLTALQLDPAVIGRTEPEVRRDLQRVCTMCPNTRVCEHDLTKSPSDPVWRKYCPNAVTLDALVAKHPKHRKTT